jgi:hypothetical protein
LAVTLPILVILVVGLFQVVMIARTYLVVLEASREGARLGARGSAFFDDSEIQTLVEQDLSREGYDAGLVDVIIVRAEVGPGAVVDSHQANWMLSSGRPVFWDETRLLSRLSTEDPKGRLVAVEIYYDHQSMFLPNALTMHTYSLMRVLR